MNGHETTDISDLNFDRILPISGRPNMEMNCSLVTKEMYGLIEYTTETGVTAFETIKILVTKTGLKIKTIIQTENAQTTDEQEAIRLKYYLVIIPLNHST